MKMVNYSTDFKTFHRRQIIESGGLHTRALPTRVEHFLDQTGRRRTAVIEKQEGAFQSPRRALL